jgi:hypothetical protein
MLSLVERVFRDYPDRVRELEILDNAITAACRPGGLRRVDGSCGNSGIHDRRRRNKVLTGERKYAETETV